MATIWNRSRHKKYSQLEFLHQQRCLFLLHAPHKSKQAEPYFEGIVELGKFICQRYEKHVQSSIKYPHLNIRSTTRKQLKAQFKLNQKPMYQKIINNRDKMAKENEFCFN